MSLRDYQDSCVRGSFEQWRDHRSTMICAPTGTGKTRIAAEIIKRFQPQRCMFMAHRGELLYQAKRTIEGVYGLSVDLEKAELVSDSTLFGKSQVVCAMVQTMNAQYGAGKRMGRFDPREFGLLVVDEFHHAVAPGYQNVINYFTTHNPEVRILGMTATPDRLDGEALGQVCETVAFNYAILDAISDGWLVKPDQMVAHIQVDFSHIRTTAGELNGAQLAQVMESERALQGVAGACINLIGDKRTLVFTHSVHQAETLSDIFNRHHNGCSAWICGKTQEERRKELLRRFDAGELQYMVNCGCLTEGYDSPSVQVIAMAKPTKSRALYSQMLGRATRPLPGVVDGLATAEERRAAIAASAKPNCIALDFCGNSGRHKLITAADILGGKHSDQVIDRALKKAAKLGKPVNIQQTLDEVEDDLRREAEERKLKEASRKAKLVAKVSCTTSRIDPFDVFNIEPIPRQNWHSGKALSEKEQTLLLRQGIDPYSMPFHKARQILVEIVKRWRGKLCSMQQAAILKNHGHRTDVTRDEATRIISSLR